MGGQLRSYARHDLAIKADLEDLLSYYEVMMKKHNIEVICGTEVNAKMFRKMLHKYDVAVVATGAGIDPGDLPGREKAVTARAVLHDEVQCGKRVAVAGGGKVGLVTAEYLASIGHEVSIIEAGKRLAGDVMPTWKWRHSAWVEELNIKKITRAKLKEITDGGVIVTKEDGDTLVEVDAVVLAAPRVSRQGIFHDLEYMVDELYIVGDAVAPRGLYQAIHDGYRLGARI